ncbi:TetR/AcrR family transcriptional regulator [Novosphingobium panipatense]|uniref:TetR/AcrR family transcriptional regulator n=1 Tax=Novosphingobium panipatense TaxID=428991 RepID=UPI0036090B70
MFERSLPAAPVRAGRPTREQAQARHAALLDCALQHFLEKGYDGATIEAIAADVNMTKRTVYARHPDKAALFRAAIRHGTEARAAPAHVIAGTRRETLKDTLIAIAMLRIALVSQPGSRAPAADQHRGLSFSGHFPDLLRNCGSALSALSGRDTGE